MMTEGRSCTSAPDISAMDRTETGANCYLAISFARHGIPGASCRPTRLRLIRHKAFPWHAASLADILW
jgi:hypothetical protein